MKIIGLCGRAGAGKSTVVAILKESFRDLQAVSTGDATRRLLNNRNLEINHQNLQAITEEILADRGPDFISFIFEFIDTKSSIVLIDSFRRIQDIECVTKTFGPPVVICVDAPEELRFKRLIARSRAADALDEASFKDLKALEESWGVDEVCRMASRVIFNTQFLPEFRRQVITTFQEVISSR